MALDSKTRAGVCLHLTSLPGDHGIGEFGENAFAFVDAIRAMGLRVWQFLPLGPTGYGDSPYQALSSFAGNELLIGTGELVRLGLIRADEARPLTALPAGYTDFGRLIPLKKKILSLAAGRFEQRADGEMRAAFDDFRHRHNDRWLRDYALFRVLKSYHDERAWMKWDEPYVRREPRALQRIAAERARELEAVQLAQFLFDRQCRDLKTYAAENGVSLFGDVPIYIALDSADAWANSQIVRLDDAARPDFVAGVPPDYYSEDGQLWGNPLYDWAYHHRTGYRWWVERFRHAMRWTDLVRIDHFRGFEAYWAIPYGEKTARNGTWEPGPGTAVFSALRDGLGELPIVAENLGVITPDVEKLRTDFGMPGMVILQFDASKPDFDLDRIEENCVVYTGCHDNDTTQGWFAGGPGDVRSRAEVKQEQQVILRQTGGTPATIHRDLVRLAFASRARLAVVPMQDFLGLGSEARFNIPGTESNNWRWRLRADQLTSDVTADVAALVDASGRRTE